MSLASYIARTEFALAQTSLSDQDRLDIIERALIGLDNFKADTSTFRTNLLQLRATIIPINDIDEYADAIDDLYACEQAIEDAALERSLAPHL